MAGVNTLSEMAHFYEQQRKQGKTIALCHGTFDLLHIGHIRHLQRAASKVDCLLVTVTSDRFVNKGPGRPVFKQLLRAENIAALACVSKVAINDAETSVNVLELIKPDLYVKGNEYENFQDDLTGNIQREQEAVEKHGGQIFFTDEITSSSTHLMNDYFDIFSPETSLYLKQIRERYQSSEIIKQLQGVSASKILVVGEAIIDEYHYTSPLGQSGKANALAVKYENNECFAGGAIAVAKHVSGFVDKVTLLSVLGEKNTREDLIRENLSEQMTAEFFYANDRETITKRRYVDKEIAKLFEVYFYNEQNLPDQLDQKIVKWLKDYIAEFDIVIVADFGHGFISENIIEILTQKANYLALNAQTNSGNRGYNLITRYPRADFISLNESELRMAAQNRKGPLKDIAIQMARQLQAENIAVTRGNEGALMVDMKDIAKVNVYDAPALSSKVVDKIGVGDTFLALTGLCLGNAISPETSLLLGSAAAALDLQIVCNREPVSPTALYKYLTTLLK